jgi:hypothetical protein
MSLVKVTFIKSVKVRRYGLCGCVAACYIKSMVVCVLCAVCRVPCAVCCALCAVCCELCAVCRVLCAVQSDKTRCHTTA